MLAEDLIRKIKKLHITSRRRVDTLMAGHYRSVFRGSGMEFETVREYAPGDDVKAIDWRVSARLGRPFVKCFREERERVMILMVDMSASNRFGAHACTKREKAAEAAAILAFSAIKNNDKVGAVLFTDHVEKYVPPKKGSAHVWRLIREILSFEPINRGTDLGCALSFLGRAAHRRAMVILVSDFLDDQYGKPLKVLAMRHEVIALVLSDPGEAMLPPGGIVTAMDLETGAAVRLDAFDKRTGNAFTEMRGRHRAATLELLKNAGVQSLEIRTTDDVCDLLNAWFRRMENRARL